jgi:hypothetical protein
MVVPRQGAPLTLAYFCATYKLKPYSEKHNSLLYLFTERKRDDTF